MLKKFWIQNLNDLKYFNKLSTFVNTFNNAERPVQTISPHIWLNKFWTNADNMETSLIN